MDLSSIMNQGGEDKKGTRPDEAGRSRYPSAASPTNGQPPTPGHATPSQVRTPIHAPPPLPQVRSSNGPGLTPLATPGQSGGNGQYPFPPSAGSAVPYPFSASTPGARPPSHGHLYASPSQSQHAGLPHGVHPYQAASASPTPSSHHRHHTPQSVRQSPQSVLSHGPYQHPPPPHHQLSQPTTPLGPPPLNHQRSWGGSSHPDIPSPFHQHQRTYSTTSNGMVPLHSPSIANLVESPNAAYRPSPPHQRHTSEYLSQIQADRERSLSVSPKTKVAPRPTSLGSRGSSVAHEAQSLSSGRSSGTFGAPGSGPAPPQPVTQYVQSPQQHFQQSGQVPPQQQPLPNINSAAADRRSSMSGISQHSPQAVTQPLPTTPVARAPDMTQFNRLKRPASQEVVAQQPPPKRTMRKYTSKPPWAILSRHNPRFTSQDTQSQKPQHQAQNPNGGHAQLQPHHPPQPQQQQQPPQINDDTQTPFPGQQQYPHPPAPQQININGKPWHRDPPLDEDLIHTRSILGPWEKTFRWNTPVPDMLKALQDWFYMRLHELRDVGTDPMEGTIEIEARLGHLVNPDTGYRASLPISSAAIIHPDANHRYAFHSAMTMESHRALNEYLNKSLQASMEPGRTKMKYTHLYDTDSFYALSSIALAALPPPMKKRKAGGGRPPRLRVTSDSRTGEIRARIVKVHIDHLHIFDPQALFDVRISVNLEVNLDRPGLDPASLIASPNEPGAGPPVNEPERKKDRLSYKHLAYSIDLTKVESNPAPPPRAGEDPASYELEVEVDSTLLRQQFGLLEEGKDNAFSEVVGGFLDNVTFLMRQVPPQQQQQQQS